LGDTNYVSVIGRKIFNCFKSHANKTRAKLEQFIAWSTTTLSEESHDLSN